MSHPFVDEGPEASREAVRVSGRGEPEEGVIPSPMFSHYTRLQDSNSG